MSVHTSGGGSDTAAGIREALRDLIEPQQYETWFRSVEIQVVGSGVVRVLVPNRFHQAWIQKWYTPVIEEAGRIATGNKVHVVIDVDPSLKRTRTGRSSESAPAPVKRGVLVGRPLNPDYTFEDFVVGPSNQFCFAAARALAALPRERFNPLFIHGKAGLGKTHLLQALCRSLLEQGLCVCYIPCEEFTNEYIAALGNRSLDSFRAKYRSVDVLAVDDVDFLAQKEKTQDEFFYTFNNLYNEHKLIVLTSEHPPKEIEKIEERLLSRFGWGLVAPLERPTLETRVAILKRKALARGVELPDSVATYIAKRVTENVRELEGAVNRLIYVAQVTNRPVDTALVEEALADLFNCPGHGSIGPSLSHIVKVVAEAFGLRPADLQSRRRTKSIVYPRQVAMYLARKLTRCSLEEIGAFFGGRDHTTVLYALLKVEKLAKDQNEARDLIDRLKRKLSQ